MPRRASEVVNGVPFTSTASRAITPLPSEALAVSARESGSRPCRSRQLHCAHQEIEILGEKLRGMKIEVDYRKIEPDPKSCTDETLTELARTPGRTLLLLEGKYSKSEGLDETKAVPCRDERCTQCFPSIQDLQYHLKNVHYIDRIKRDPAKRLQRTRRSQEDGKDDLSIKSERVPYFKNTSYEPYKAMDTHVSQIPVQSRIYFTEFEKRSPSAGTTASSEDLPTMDRAMSSTPESSVCSDPPLPIDPRLLSDANPIILSP